MSAALLWLIRVFEVLQLPHACISQEISQGPTNARCDQAYVSWIQIQ
jgi:hypothetical protein